jgi:hypothetical protein
MFSLSIQRIFNVLVQLQVWIALCGWAATASWYYIIEGTLLPWSWGLLLFSAIVSAYNIYYLKNAAYPHSLTLALLGGTLALFAYWNLGLPKPMLTLLIGALSLAYMIPLKRKSMFSILMRWGLLSIIWTLATFFWPVNSFEATIQTALLFTYRILFMGNLCFFFVLKDDAQYFSPPLVSFIKNILITAHGMALLGILMFISIPIGFALIMPFFLIILFYKKQKPHGGVLFYSLGIDGLLILESIFVQSLLIYGLGRFSIL